MPNYRKPTDKETERLNKSRKMMVEGIEGEKDFFSKISTTMAKDARDQIKAGKSLRETVPVSAREGEAYQDAGYKKGGKVKKVRKFDDGGTVSPKTTRLPSELSGYSDAERKAMSIGFQRETPDYLRVVEVLGKQKPKDTSYVNALDKAQRMGIKPGSEDFNLLMKSQMRNSREDYTNKALEKVKTTAADAGKRLMNMTPQGRIARDVISMARQYPRGSEGESSFEQEMGMKKGGKVSSASKRADGIAIRGKTRA